MIERAINRRGEIELQETPRIWVLWSTREGDRNQAEALAKRIGWPYRVIKIEAPENSQSARGEPGPPWPDVIISVDKKCSAYALKLKKQSHGAIKIVKIDRPTRTAKRLSNFLRGRKENVDLFIVPGERHARPGPGIVQLDLPFNLVDATTLTLGHAQFPELDVLPQPRIAVLVGGITRLLRWTLADARKLGKDVNALAKDRGGSLMITTSYRTGIQCADAILSEVEVPYAAYVWGKSAGPNPFMGYLAHADLVVATMDSVSMVAEAVCSGKPVMVYRLTPTLKLKLKNLAGIFVPMGGRDELFNKLARAGALTWFDDRRPRPPNLKYIDRCNEVVEAVKRLV